MDLIQRLIHRIARRLPTVETPASVSGESAVAPRVTRRYDKNRKLIVERDKSPLWESRGWHRDGDKLRGAYRTPLGSFGRFHRSEIRR